MSKRKQLEHELEETKKKVKVIFERYVESLDVDGMIEEMKPLTNRVDKINKELRDYNEKK